MCGYGSVECGPSSLNARFEEIIMNMKKYKFAISKDGYTHFVIVEGQGRFEAERNAKMMYATAKSITFQGEVL